MVQATTSNKNIWVAASDGDIARVRALIEGQGVSPNAKDSNSYTPMHAAASYAHIELLEYLISKGGDINLADEDGDTPLFTVETIEMAEWMIAHGADPALQNEEGLNAAQALEEDHPEISVFLNGLNQTSDPLSNPAPNVNPAVIPPTISALAVDNYATSQTQQLIQQTREIMEQAEREGINPDERLRQVVEQAVRNGFNLGGVLGEGGGAVNGDLAGGEVEKRPRQS